MRSDREFFIRLAPPITAAEVSLFALNIRSLYTRIVLEKIGSRLQREIHDRDSMYSYEDQIGFECLIPPAVLREQVIMQSVDVGFLPPESHGSEYAEILKKRLKEITG